ncbi:hypothetical protein KO504_11600 [Winogradskyella psychrotolerans]|uniref:hypothetical protein n=1 Tax=Winogradskyella psychrotolerans TaxID=1344585 RepID=UPI001C06F836|nr:hypothetical protein [Winogradskyella psychrotolerans]MBU2921988.1 hypothetical protein [Winogradskyella psychrotolerans]
MKNTSNKYLIAALLIGIAFHGTSIFFTLETTYDALIHLFFADHYATSWFEPWNYKWYTGFTVMSYPPLVHQSIAVLSLIGGLKFGMFTVALLAIVLFITGVYRFSLLITSNRTAAGYAALLAVFSSSFVETLHVFGQLPSIIGISVLMHALPEIYLWLKTGKWSYLATSLSLIAVTVTSHHVTPIFGMIFFIFPLIGMVIMDHSRDQVDSVKAITFKVFLNSFFKLFKRIISFGMLSLVIIVGCILPYWINSKNNPITQVPIPHGSRDNFLEITSSGLVFFLIPWGILLILLPYIFYRYYTKRYLFFGLSMTILVVLGTGGTTPIPRLLLGETAFNILTLDRFTLWASIMSLPLFGEFTYRFVEGDLKTLIQNKFGAIYHRLIGGLLAGLFLFMTIFTMSLSYFKPSQPQRIEMLPIVNFLNQDNHDQWRYMTLGFGDQMAWLSAQTNAMSVDGNYHSARRLPELTTRPIERLENSKFKGVEGIGSLQQFLTTPEKYNFKYIFSNDKFYDPILYFCGWQRLRQLENGIMVWEKLNVPPLSSILPKDDVSTWQKILWGIIPFLTVLIAFVLNIQMLWIRLLKTKAKKLPAYLKFQNDYSKFSSGVLKITHIWSFILALIVCYGTYIFYIKNESHHSPENAILAYYDALDFKEFETAHSLINPKSDIPIAQYMLEISVTDGLLSSYAKLDAITTETLSKTDSLASLKVFTDWITPLEKIKRVDYKTLVKLDNKWYIQPEDIDLDLPPDQLYSSNSTNYFNQGRRRITTEETHHEDILKQPVLEILKAKLVKFENHYAIIGEIQNIDNVPADVVLKGTLYNDDNKFLATYNAKYHVNHKLMPKEVSSFRINFEGIAWSKTQDSIPKTFNPDEFTPIELEEQPTKFNLQVAGNISGSDLFKNTTITISESNDTHVSGTLFNTGIEEVTIPQLLMSYYDADKNLVWVDHFFVKEGIRQQRSQTFDFPLLTNETVRVINEDMSNCFVNGLPNTAIASKIVPNRIWNHHDDEFQKIDHPIYKFIKLEINTYIGNPN